MKKFVFIFTSFNLVANALGQEVEKLSLESSYGFIIPHSQALKPLSQSNPLGFSLHYQKLNQSQKSWDACNCFHYLGLQFSYHDFGNPPVLGHALSLTGTFEPILWKNERWTFSLLSGLGFSYLSKVYDEDNNPDNIFFSAPVSFLLFLSPKWEYIISDKIALNLSFAYNHISNGGQSQPNKGMNYPMLGLGLVHFMKNYPFPFYEKKMIPKSSNFYLETGLSTREGEEGRIPNLSLVMAFKKPISGINGIGGGLEINKDYSLEVENKRWEALMPAPFISHHFLFGKFDFSQRMAFYTNKPNNYHDFRFYQRYVLNYFLFQNFSIGIGLKAHGHVAEHLDLRLGWSF
ncbi:acyloxyacyl hydrolase [Cecembia calidifontis]|uniref:acyloxyacyl hydrolase n=1 Tax=Cecembia calidifontis TaxID=1187080 RepID=UPI001A9228CF|nr:acyloxyacyl hydrolase [Cecembia calidifontis]